MSLPKAGRESESQSGSDRLQLHSKLSPLTGQSVTQKRPWPPSADLEELCCEEVDADESESGRLGGHTGILGQLSRKLHAMWGPGLWRAAEGLRPTGQ